MELPGQEKNPDQNRQQSGQKPIGHVTLPYIQGITEHIGRDMKKIRNSGALLTSHTQLSVAHWYLQRTKTVSWISLEGSTTLNVVIVELSIYM